MNASIISNFILKMYNTNSHLKGQEVRIILIKMTTKKDVPYRIIS